MNVIIGYVVVLGMIFGAFLIHGGNISVVLKAMPTELMAIFGGAFGAFVVGNQSKVLKATIALLPSIFKPSKYTKERYLELMSMLYTVLTKIRKEGLMSIEGDIEKSHDSPLFNKFTTVSNDHHVMKFLTDYLRMMVSGSLNAFEIENLMDIELETHHHEAHAPIAAINRLGDALPAFGIVAAVLGVVNTMSSVGEPPSVLGGMIGSALVGTFLGILLAYGIVAPLGSLLEQKLDEETKELHCIKAILLASMQGYAPQSAVEFGRKVINSTERPEFAEMESHIKGNK
ncbi:MULTISPECIES: flagellar motor stator protein MotA [Chromobacterium]|uniref:flagellar motor stator protein MotA n=1 Tax=Chromobacterium TaxID=535 RepID=UPI001F2DDE20|nr:MULTISPECIES: flagellar motor stator protein MotA [Chromobacterium]MCS3802689.1 chemotaxis protein MotA [Chromobacterium alkanivorans]MCS3817015.1 chemotaxis protein MotA [Chromobacterium alkanivorans]MCS3872055.1 chemotaxis protein MotA [Chromobacterium alkanivorans]UJB33614.1 flagellar motor stator protein MotA [Chromobacterium sp. Beijing]